jgi:DNA-binding response OmpR family regulator
MPTDIVIMDLMLPYVSGTELITRIRESRDWKDVPVVVLSGKVTERAIVNAFEIGANDYVTKPYNPQELRARIKRLLALQRKA